MRCLEMREGRGIMRLIASSTPFVMSPSKVVALEEARAAGTSSWMEERSDGDDIVT